MDTPGFVHLRVHSEYSIVDGIVRLPELMVSCQDLEMPAVALTDEMNLFAAVKFYEAAISAGIKPIFGVDACLATGDNRPHTRFTLLCQNMEGYRNLTMLVSLAYTERTTAQQPIVIQQAWLTPESTQGLIALSGGADGDLAHALLHDDQSLITKRLEFWLNLLGDRFYLEIHRVGHPSEEAYLPRAIALAEEKQVAVVATNSVRFLTRDDYQAHEVRVCIHAGKTLQAQRGHSPYHPEQYLKSPAQMHELFADIPEALTNTIEIAKRCNVMLSLGKSCLPIFKCPDKLTPELYVKDLAKQGLENYLASLDHITPEQRAVYHDRLITELEVITTMGFASYFLIVADFIQWTKDQGIMVGPGRGSGAGSLVAFALGITALDPIPYDLLFERFLNPERISMPDFDIDFCMEGRDRVIEYVMERYGRDSVAQIITYGSLAAKAAVRDVGRVLNHPYGFVDAIAKLIPFELGITLERALEQEEVLRTRYEQEEEVKALMDMAMTLEGLTRNAGKHAGGVVIAPSKLTDFTPLYCEPGEGIVTQFDKDDVEAAGLVKFDFLGLRTLTIIDWTLQTLQQAPLNLTIDINRIPLDDPAAYDLLKACQTTAVFQLESRGMKDLIRRLQPDCFEDIVALVALFRPGPLQSGMVDDFIDRKHGRAAIIYPHPSLEQILRPTYGVILYQEQVMQIAQVLAGYTLGGADLLRRAMGKKKPEEMAKQRSIFVKGSVEQGVKADVATTIFDLMEKFAGYGFNKSHSCAYALIAYQTAWLKAHYPAAFMASVLSSDMDNTDKVVDFINECYALNLKITPPDINQCYYRFTVGGDNEIIYGLGAIKGVGEGAIEHILEVRKEGPFIHLFDFCKRINLRKVNRRTLEALIRAGALDKLGPSRASLMATLNRAIKAAEQQSQHQEQVDLFAVLDTTSTETPEFIQDVSWSNKDMLQHEKTALGFYLSGHPIDSYKDQLTALNVQPLNALESLCGQTARVAAYVQNIRIKFTKRGEKIAFLVLDDGNALIEASVFTEPYRLYHEELREDEVLIVEGEVSHDDFSGSLRLLVRHVHRLEHYRMRFMKYLKLNLDVQTCTEKLLKELTDCLNNYPGDHPVYFQYRQNVTQGLLKSKAQIRPTETLLNDLRHILGYEQVEVVF